MKNSENLSYSLSTKYSFMPTDVKHTLNQMYNDRLKMKRKKRNAFNKRKHKDFANHKSNTTRSVYKRRNIEKQNKFNVKGGESNENEKTNYNKQ